MAVKVIIRRKVPKQCAEALLPLLLEQRASALAQPGYVSGETLINVHDPRDYVVISTWRSVEDWNAWAASSKRARVQEKINRLLGRKTQHDVYLCG